ncbi:MAG: hypothetical protein OEW11_00620 [Nitrospirota bacterium]|nr:hypothetical protein [Nitrospirota bacterium]
MAVSAILVFGLSSALFSWGVVLGVKACMTDHAPFMQGEGHRARFDERMRKAA